MCQRGRTGAHSWAQSIRRQAGAPSVQFSPVNLRNFTPVLTRLTNECETLTSDIELALAAANAWLASDEAASAIGLLRASANRIAAMGEPVAAADILSQLLARKILPDARIALLNEVAIYAHAGGISTVATSALRQLLELETIGNHPPAALRVINLRILESEALERTAVTAEIPQLRAVLEDNAASTATRHRAAMLMLVSADSLLDVHTAAEIAPIVLASQTHDTQAALSLQLVYHTVFGSVRRSHLLADKLLLRYNRSADSEDAIRARKYVAYSCMRLQRHKIAQAIAEEDYAACDARGDRSAAVWWASLLSDSKISTGDFNAAQAWLDEAQRQMRDMPAEQINPSAGYASNATMLAVLGGRFDEAERILDEGERQNSRLHYGRSRAVGLALRLRIQMLRGDEDLNASYVRELTELFERGKGLGGHDTQCEMLWWVKSSLEGKAAASELLGSYLNVHRREIERPEWLLRNTSAEDVVWQRYDSRLGRKPRKVNRRS